MGILLAAVLALVPLLITPGLLFYFDVTPKIIVLLVGTAVALPWFCASPKGLETLWAGSASRWFCLLLAAQALLLAISTVGSTNVALSLNGSNWRRFGLISYAGVLVFAFLVAAYVAADPGRVRYLLRLIAGSGLLAALYGVLQYFGWDPWIPPRLYHIGEGIWTIVRPPGTLGYVSYFANYLLYVVFAGAALLLAEQQRFWKILGGAAVAVGSAAVVLSGTRAAMLALAAGGVFLLFWLRPRITRRGVAFAVLLAAGGAVFYYSPPGWKLRSRTRWYIEDPRGGARLRLWQDSLRMALERPVRGYGPETFATDFPRFQSLALARAYPDFYHESPHNIFLDAFTAQGAAGPAVLMLLSALGLYAAWRSKPASSALGAALAAALVSQQFTVFLMPTALYFYVTVAMLVAGVPLAAPAPTFSSRVWRASLAGPVAALLAGFALQLFIFDRSLARVRRHLDAGRPKEAIREYQHARKWAPRGTSSDLWYSRRLAAFAETSPEFPVRLETWQEALQAATRAASTAEDRHNAYYNLATFHAGQNNYSGTEESLRAAISWAPRWFKPRWMLARVLHAAGRPELAETEAAVAVQLNAGKNPEVDQTLQEIRAAASQGRKK